jgi:hypothetical protein
MAHTPTVMGTSSVARRRWRLRRVERRMGAAAAEAVRARRGGLRAAGQRLPRRGAVRARGA